MIIIDHYSFDLVARTVQRFNPHAKDMSTADVKAQMVEIARKHINVDCCRVSTFGYEISAVECDGAEDMTVEACLSAFICETILKEVG